MEADFQMNARRSKALTLVELLISITIIGVIAAVVFPVASKTIAASKRSQCASNLRQIGIGIALYRSDYDGDGKFGYWANMGLPPNPYGLIKLKYLTEEVFDCGGIPYPNGAPPEYLAMSYTSEDWEWARDRGMKFELWVPYVRVWKEESILVADFHHPLGENWDNANSMIHPHRAIGLYLNGSVMTKVKAGDPARRAWWHD